MLVGLSCDSLGACLDSLGRSSAPLRLCWTLLEVSCVSLGIPRPPLGPSWVPLGLLLGSPGPLWAPSWALLGLSWASLGSLLGVPRKNPKNDPLLDASWLVFIGFWAPILDQFWVNLWIPFWIPFLMCFLWSSWTLFRPKGRPKRGQARTRRTSKGRFCCYLRGFWHIAPFCCLSSVLVPSCSLLVPPWPLSLPFGSHFGSKIAPKMASETVPF